MREITVTARMRVACETLADATAIVAERTAGVAGVSLMSVAARASGCGEYPYTATATFRVEGRSHADAARGIETALRCAYVAPSFLRTGVAS